MTCFAMMTLSNGRIFPILGADGAVRLFEDYEHAIEAAEESNTAGYAIYENLNRITPLEVEADGPDGDDGLVGNGTH